MKSLKFLLIISLCFGATLLLDRMCRHFGWSSPFQREAQASEPAPDQTPSAEAGPVQITPASGWSVIFNSMSPDGRYGYVQLLQRETLASATLQVFPIAESGLTTKFRLVEEQLQAEGFKTSLYEQFDAAGQLERIGLRFKLAGPKPLSGLAVLRMVSQKSDLAFVLIGVWPAEADAASIEDLFRMKDRVRPSE